MNRNLDISGACRQKTTFHQFFLSNDYHINTWKGYTTQWFFKLRLLKTSTAVFINKYFFLNLARDLNSSQLQKTKVNCTFSSYAWIEVVFWWSRALLTHPTCKIPARRSNMSAVESWMVLSQNHPKNMLKMTY